MEKDDAAASLDRLHDIVLPEPVPWWPPAPGWYFLAGLVLIAIITLAWLFFRRWKADAYRREALSELESADDDATIAALLRRVALSENGRHEIAPLEGDRWVDWLSEKCPDHPPPTSIREQLTGGIYRKTSASNPSDLRAWAAHWIRNHHTRKSPESSPVVSS